MKNIFKNVAFLLFLSNICTAQIESLDLIPVKDNSMFSESPTNSDGAGHNLYVGKTNGTGVRRALLKFDFSALPANAQIQSVSLKIPVMQASAGTTAPHVFSLHKLNADWGEGTSNSSGTGAPATPNDATWTYSFYNSSSWVTQGGDFQALASASSSVVFATFPLQYGIWSSVGMKNDILSWLSLPSNNFGWILVGEESTSGSAKKFTSREETFFPKPTLTVLYTLPLIEKVLINEVNPNKKWIEIYNPSQPLANLANYYISNGNTSESLANMTVLNGNLQLDSAKYVVINWSGISTTDGEIALYDGKLSNNASIMKDYLQYGSANHAKSANAVIAQVWDNTNSFLPTIFADTISYSLNGNNIYSSGKATNSTSFLNQRQTPTYKNLICSSLLTLSGNIIDAKYTASNQLKLTGNINATSNVQLTSSTSILLQSSTLILGGAKFEAKIAGCSNN